MATGYMTLLEAAKTADPLSRLVMETYAQSEELLRVLPFETISGAAKKWNREHTLASTGFRAINASWTAAQSVTDPQIESTFIAGGTLVVDNYLLAIGTSREAQERMKVKSLAHKVGYTFIKGDQASDATAPNGLQVRANTTDGTLIANGSTSGGDVLTLAKLDEAIDAVPGANALYMSKAMRRLLTKGIRAGIDSPITYGKDEFGRQVAQYAGLPILVGDGVDMVNTTLAFDEANPGGGSSVGTSIYVMRVGIDGVHGIQTGGPPKVEDIGHSVTPSAMATLVEWYCGLAVAGKNSFARLYGIKTGTPTA